MASEMDSELDAEAPEDDDLDALGDDALLEDELDDEEIGEEDVLDDEIADVDDVVEVPVAPRAVAAEGDELLAEDEEDELEDDDVEASLDVILKERLVVVDEEDEEDEEEPSDAEDRAEGTTRVLPKQPGEFVCQSCFLVKSDTQLADAKRGLCRDCV